MAGAEPVTWWRSRQNMCATLRQTLEQAAYKRDRSGRLQWLPL